MYAVRYVSRLLFFLYVCIYLVRYVVVYVFR